MPYSGSSVDTEYHHGYTMMNIRQEALWTIPAAERKDNEKPAETRLKEDLRCLTLSSV